MNIFQRLKRRAIVIRNAFGICFFIASGFFVYMMSLFGFIELPEPYFIKFMVMGLFLIFFIIFQLIGCLLYKTANWKVSTGLTLLIGGGFNLFVIISIASMGSSPQIGDIMQTSALTIFSDYVIGAIAISITMGLGVLFYLLGKQKLRLFKD